MPTFQEHRPVKKEEPASWEEATAEDEAEVAPTKRKARASKVGKGECRIFEPSAVEALKKAAKLTPFYVGDTKMPIDVTYTRAKHAGAAYANEQEREMAKRANNAKTEARRRLRLEIMLYLIASLIPLPANAQSVEKIGTEGSVMWITYQYLLTLQEEISRYPNLQRYLPRDSLGNRLPTLAAVHGMTPYNGIGQETSSAKKHKKTLTTDLVQVRPNISPLTRKTIESSLANRMAKEAQRAAGKKF
jgi:hypothetical protein